jgi:hypothetical protein
LDQDYEEPPDDQRAFRRLDPNIEGYQGPAEDLYAAFLDPIALIDWLLPAEMTGEIHEFGAQDSTRMSMSLFEPPERRSSTGCGELLIR